MIRWLTVLSLALSGWAVCGSPAKSSDSDTLAAHDVAPVVTGADRAALVFGDLPAKYRSCEPILDDIDRAVGRWSPHYPYRMQWLGQIWQESRCNRSAVSPVGARGYAQFMPPTCREEFARFGLSCDPHSEISVEIGLAYLVRYGEGFWTRGLRDPVETRRWAQGCYNAGCGTVLNAQRAAQVGLARGVYIFAELGPYLPEETERYVDYNERWWRELCDPRNSLCAPVMLRLEWRR